MDRKSPEPLDLGSRWCVHVESLGRVQLLATLWTAAHQVLLSMGFFRQKLVWVAVFLLQGIFASQGSNPCLLCLLHCRWILYLLTQTGKPRTGWGRSVPQIADFPCDPTYWCLVTQSCPTLCNSIDCSQPGTSAHGISQASILEWVAISFSTPTNQIYFLFSLVIKLARFNCHLASQAKDYFSWPSVQLSLITWPSIPLFPSSSWL